MTAASRIGLGCMRFSTEATRDDARSLDVIDAALDAGVTLFDTAHAYALDDSELGHNERLLAKAIARRSGAEERVRIVTKGGMTRPNGAWRVDARARAIVDDCDASISALDGLPIALYLLHAPDPAVPFATSVRALASLLDRGKVKSIGVSNVNRAQLAEALSIAPIAAIEVSLSWLDDDAIKGGVVSFALEHGLEVIAHRPLAGAKRIRTVLRDRDLRAIAEKHKTTSAQIALASLIDLDERVVAIPSASTPEHVRENFAAQRIALDDDDRALLSKRLSRKEAHGSPAPIDLKPASEAEVVLLMGIQGAGKTEALSTWIARGYERINRDERGGTMKQLHRHLDERLAAGSTRVVLDNTYVTRTVRRDLLETAWKHKVGVRGLWFDTPLAAAQVNVVMRMLKQHGRLLEPDEMQRADDPTKLPPHAQHRTLRTLETPALDEGFHALDVVEFVRKPWPGAKSATFVSFDVLPHVDLDPDAPTLVYAWNAPSNARDVVKSKHAFASFANCPHGAGPPICWCRPPLPGLVLQWALANDVDPSKSVVYANGPAHRALASAIGARFVDVSSTPREPPRQS